MPRTSSVRLILAGVNILMQYHHLVKDLVLAKDKIIVALDVASAKEARELVRRLGGRLGWFKVGLKLFTAAGPAVVEEIKKSGAKAFLDLKFHDIPNTVRQAVRSACAMGADMLTIHLGGASAMWRPPAEGRAGTSNLLLGVTVVTRQNDSTLAEVGTKANVTEQMLLIATLAK